MQFSILIVSYNRKADLQKSLAILETQIDIMVTEVLVYLDGCKDGSQELKKNFSWVHWIICPTCLGASAARAKLYPMAKGEILIGLDDDAHFISKNYFENIKNIFAQQPNTALIAFEEVKGVFQSDKIALQHSSKEYKQYQCADFIGCGFAVRKSMYKLTNGFPIWVDIYGEESCLSIEILDKGFDIVFDNSIKVNHRVDISKRKSEGKNYFRFGKQLKNITYYYLVYYKKPLFPILKLYFHNFKKYALTDFHCFKIFIKVIFQVFFNFP
jgi:GT2 family glycosyltransferase